MTRSCLVKRIEHYVDLGPAERDYLARAEAEPVRHARRAVIARIGEALDDVYVLRSGWLVARTSDPHGAEMVAEIYHPGDLVGVSQLGCEMSTLTYVAATDIELCTLPKSSLPRLFVEFPRLIALFFAFVAVERATLIDRLRAIGRMSARDCVALFLLQTAARLELSGALDEAGDRFHLPLSQEIVGNAVGLSVVSVNRALRRLEDQGHLTREGRLVGLARRAELAREVDFVDRVYRIDHSWLPMGVVPAGRPGV